MRIIIVRNLDVPEVVAWKGKFDVHEKHAFQTLSHCIECWNIRCWSKNESRYIILTLILPYITRIPLLFPLVLGLCL